jgi:very-short-patch-repair endonuclease
MKTCLTCGKVFRTVPAYDKQFCSVRCYRRHTGETIPESNARRTLENIGIRFLQEHAFVGLWGPVDFFLPDLGTIIEIDGVYWHQLKEVRERDARKSLWLQSRGYKVIRLPDTPFYGELTSSMIDFVRGALGLTDKMIGQQEVGSLYPIQLALPLDQ